MSQSQLPRAQSSTSSEAIRQSYTSEYYLTDCGGHQAYQETGGRYLADERLLGVAAIASLRTSGRVLDLGCGRGELALYFASLGHEVTAVDYSRDAIDLAEKTFSGSPALRSRVDLLCENVGSLRLVGEYEIVVASDVIEHLSPGELDGLYEAVSHHLSSSGIFVTHTYPNLWFFQYDYVRKRRLAVQRHEFLPEQPRSKFELLMHINEQNPRVLRKQLARCFPNVLLWFGEPSDMGGSLLRPFSHQQLAGARDLCAVASKNPIDVEQLRCRLQSVPLPPVALRKLHLAAGEPPRAVYVDEEFTLEIKLDNRTPVVFGSSYPNPVVVSYRWMLPDGRVAVADGLRSAIKPPMVPGHHRSIPARIAAPARPGPYILRVTLVQEGVQWFDSPEIGVFCELPTLVSARPQ